MLKILYPFDKESPYYWQTSLTNLVQGEVQAVHRGEAEAVCRQAPAARPLLPLLLPRCAATLQGTQSWLTGIQTGLAGPGLRTGGNKHCGIKRIHGDKIRKQEKY